jgi:tetratricopeptide (TPR) repeat protein
MSFDSHGGQNYGILAHRFMSARQWDRSLAATMEWLSKEPENQRAHRAAAQSLINLNRTEEASRHLEKVLAGNPADNLAHRLMAEVHFRAGKFRLADESIQKAISLCPTDAHHWYKLAHMSYRLGDLATAKKSVARARELSPRSADILNLAILCEPETAAEAKIRQYQDALALNPENANIHNNMGTEYLNKLKDYAKAEECFRRALFFNPTSDIFRQNLFVTLKHRDLVYRILCLPKDWQFKVIKFFDGMRKRNLLLYILIIALWLVAFRFVLGGLVLWFALFWPLTKVYEFLTMGDIRARAGELGVRRGGFLGYRRWPLKIRLSLFAVFLISFWGGLALFWWGKKELGSTILGIVMFFGVSVILVISLMLKIKRGIKAQAARKRARQMEGLTVISNQNKSS